MTIIRTPFLHAGEYTAMGIGVFIFCLLIGPAALDPTNFGWLMAGSDAHTNYLGWEFFRREDLWQLPLGKNTSYGTSLGGSIVYSDSIPLLAILLKPIQGILPANFQYNGLWLLSCFSLQGLFSYKLLGLFTKNRVAQCLSVPLFILAPIFLIEASVHHALAAHWLIIAALYFYFNPKTSYYNWLLLLISASLIHAYLLVIILSVWAANLLNLLLQGRSSIKKLVIQGSTTVFAIALCMYLAGYFTVNGHTQLADYGLARNNLLSIVDPMSYAGITWSIFLPSIPTVYLDQPGYAGAGVLFSFILALCLIPKSPIPQKNGKELKGKEYLIIMLVAGALFIFSLSNTIYAGENLIYSYKYFDIINFFASTFRVLSRFFWLAFYLATFTAIIVILKKCTKIQSTIIILCLAALQVVDTSQLTGFSIKYKQGNATWESNLKSNIWPEFVKNYTTIKYVAQSNNSLHIFQQANIQAFAHLAVNNGLSINTAYLARYDREQLKLEQNTLESLVVRGKKLPPALYIFNKKSLWLLAASNLNDDDFYGHIDGYYVIAPAPKNCSLCTSHNAVIKKDLIKKNFQLEAGKNIIFNNKNSSQQHLIQGWSSPENTGVWTNKIKSSVYFSIDEKFEFEPTIAIKATAHLPKVDHTQEVSISINGRFIKKVLFTKNLPNKEIMVKVPLETLKDTDSIYLEFNFSDTYSPSDYSSSKDTRELGLFLREVKLM
jgi:hypothetical protein